jgi:cytochrome c-type biogenesis protein CcmH
MKLWLVFFLVWSASSFASIETYPFDTQQQEATYTELVNELRCVVCQNQNLSDSNAKLAKDLRTQIHQLVVTEHADKQTVIDYMVARYGEFVLYKPPFALNTLLLWFAPLLFLGFGIVVAIRMMRHVTDGNETI